MKGLKIIRADLSNCIDVYALQKEAVESGAFPIDQVPTEDQMKSHYFNFMLRSILPNPGHFIYLARRGRGFLGYIHAFVMPNRWTGQTENMMIDILYVTEKRRGNGIGKMLIESVKETAKNLGVKRILLLGNDGVLDYWEKHGAKKVSNYLNIEV